ncbi:MAG: methylisocitrate lyase [Candidatus Sulfobium sp.]
MVSKPGELLRKALADEKPLQVVGTINAFSAIMAERVGFRAIYLSGAGVANACFGLPDLGMTTLTEVADEARRITGASSLPLIVDVDTGWGSAFMIGRTVREMIRAEAAAIHIEDQVVTKRCGQRPGKRVVSAQEMADRLKAAIDAKTCQNFVVVARTDAMALEGLEASIERACLYSEAGADMIFPEAMSKIDDYKRFTGAVDIPVLANITEFGVTPLFTLEELSAAGVGAVLYPLSAFRAMNAAALNVYRNIRQRGTQRGVLDIMQTREELYDFLNYYDYERKKFTGLWSCSSCPRTLIGPACRQAGSGK